MELVFLLFLFLLLVGLLLFISLEILNDIGVKRAEYLHYYLYDYKRYRVVRKPSGSLRLEGKTMFSGWKDMQYRMPFPWVSNLAKVDSNYKILTKDTAKELVEYMNAESDRILESFLESDETVAE